MHHISLEMWKFGISQELVVQAGCQVCRSLVSACPLVRGLATQLESQGGSSASPWSPTQTELLST